MPTMRLGEIDAFCRKALIRCGANEVQAHAVALSITEAEAEGIRNVGLKYFPIYLQHLKCGKVKGNAAIYLVNESASSCVVDADWGFCHAAYLAFEDLLYQKARNEGSATLAIRHSYSAGVLGFFNRRLAMKGLMSLMFANSSKAVAAHGGKVPFFGTNPLSFGSPQRTAEPIIVDMATSATARVNIADAASAGHPIELGLAIDRDGAPTTDAVAALEGAQLPLGGAKGFGLGLMVDLMAGALTGSHCSYEASMFDDNEGDFPNVGQTIIAIDPDFFNDDYLNHVDKMVTALTKDNNLRLPGARRESLRRQHASQGVNIPQDLIDHIQKLLP